MSGRRIEKREGYGGEHLSYVQHHSATAVTVAWTRLEDSLRKHHHTIHPKARQLVQHHHQATILC